MDVHIRRLREKIESNPSEPKLRTYQMGCRILFSGVRSRMQVKHSRYVRRVNLHSLFTRATSQSPYKKNSSEEQYESQLESQI